MMSAIAGLWYWDGRSVSPDKLATLAEHSRAGGLEAAGTVTPAPGLVLQTHLLHFDALSVIERQPWIFGEGSVLTWDGRLDNRDDLLIALHHVLESPASDAAVVAAAYRQWGLDCLPRLIGDWSLAIWDTNTHSVLLARDYMGNRPLYYTEMSDGIGWATRLDALAACFDLYGRPDEGYIAGTLTFGAPPELTPFESARALRAGHYLLARPRQVTVRRYWTFRADTLRYADPRDYPVHLRQLLTEAVRVRLRANRTVWSHLSGGWDSSSIVCLAHALIQRGLVEAPALQPLSGVSSASPESDESPFIAMVERWCGLTTVRREFVGLPGFIDMLGHRQPFTVTERFTRDLPVQEAGDRILLNGTLGDLVMQRSAFSRTSLLEPLHSGHPLQFLRLCYTRSRAMRRPFLATLGHLAAEAYLPMLGARSFRRRHLAERAKKRHVRIRDTAAIFGVTQALLARAPQRWLTPGPSVVDFPIVKQPIVKMLYGVAEFYVSPDLAPAVWETCPYAHRPLVEFVLAVPQLALWDPVVPRAGMKRALDGILPPGILERTTKGNPMAALQRAHRQRAGDLADMRSLLGPAAAWQLVRRGYLDARAVTEALDGLRYLTPDGDLPSEWLHLEAWLRTLDGEQTPPPCSRRSAPCWVTVDADHEITCAGAHSPVS